MKAIPASLYLCNTMPNGIQTRTFSWCRTCAPCHPWGDLALWYCWACSRWYEIDVGVRRLRRLLFPRDGAPASATRFAHVFNQDVLAFVIIDFVEDWGSDLDWGRDAH